MSSIYSNLQHRQDAHAEWHTVHSDEAHSSDPALELARWLDVEEAVDEPGEWRCMVRLPDCTEVVGEEITIEIGESR
jgi:hypothetical protein